MTSLTSDNIRRQLNNDNDHENQTDTIPQPVCGVETREFNPFFPSVLNFVELDQALLSLSPVTPHAQHLQTHPSPTPRNLPGGNTHPPRSMHMTILATPRWFQGPGIAIATLVGTTKILVVNQAIRPASLSRASGSGDGGGGGGKYLDRCVSPLLAKVEGNS
jgi:hypothetical protein